MSTEPTNLKTLKIYWKYWVRHPWLFSISLLLGPAYVFQNIFSLYFVAKAIGHLATYNTVDWNYIVYAAISLVGGLTLWYLCDQYVCTPLDTNVLQDMYEDSFHHLISQEYGFFTDNFAGSLVTQNSRFVKSYELFHVTFFLNILGQLCGVLVAIGIMLYYNTTIGLVIGSIWIFSILLVIYLVRIRMPHRRIAAEKESVQTGELADALSNASVIKTFASEENEETRYSITNNERSKLISRSWHIAVKNNFIVQSLCGLLLLSLVVLGIHAVEAKEITIATYLLFQVYILLIINNVSSATLIARQVEGILGDSHEMTLLLERQPVVKDPKKPEKLQLKKGEVAFKSVDFSYDSKSKSNEIFNKFDLTIKPGERVGLVGPSGGGKTTVTKLLLRFIDVQSGSISIDGQDIRDIKQVDLHNAIGYVPQEPLLFHRSLYENISYGNPSCSKDDVVSASKEAHADDFISQLPEGYKTLVGERGIKLSGGQRQRVAIARAILKNAPILVLDEATSALDSESEKYIQEALWDLMKGKTALVIAHRLSTIQHLDRIIVLDEGRIIEEGTHAELLKAKGLYAKLWAHQSGGFLEI